MQPERPTPDREAVRLARLREQRRLREDFERERRAWLPRYGSATVRVHYRPTPAAPEAPRFVIL